VPKASFTTLPEVSRVVEQEGIENRHTCCNESRDLTRLKPLTLAIHPAFDPGPVFSQADDE